MIRLRVLLTLFLVTAYEASGGACEECLDSDNGCTQPIPFRPVLNHSLRRNPFPWTKNTTFVNSTLLNDVRIVASLRDRLWQKHASDLKVCMELCMGECEVVDYDIVGQICTTYNGGADVTFVKNNHFVVFSPIRKQLARLPGFRGTSDLIDLEYENQNLARSLEEEMTELLCQKLCLLHPQCDAAIFNVTLGSCQLKKQLPLSRYRIRQKPLAGKDSIIFFSIWKKDFIWNTLWSDEECKSWKTGECVSFNCRSFACVQTSENDIDKHLAKVGQALSKRSPITLFIYGKVRFEPASFEPILDRVILFAVGYVQGFDSAALSSLHFSNLLELSFSNCMNVTIRKGSLNSFLQLRVLTFSSSTIVFLEAGVLETLPNLKSLVLDLLSRITWPPHDNERSHLWRLHCSREYSWFRNHLTKNPYPLQPRSEGEVYSEAGVVSSSWSRRDMYSAVDCGKADLKGHDNQTEFSLSPENETSHDCM